MRLRVTVLVALIARAAAAASHADLSVELSVPARLPVARPAITGTVRNNGPDAAENVTVTATTSNGQRFEIPIGTVYPIAGQPFTVTFPATDAEFRLEARVSSSTPDPDSANDVASGPVQVTSAPSLFVSLNFPTADPGQLVVYEAQFANSGANEATHVAFTLPLDGGWTFGQSLTPRLQCAPAAEQVRCTIDSVGVREWLLVRFTLRAPNRREGEAFHSTLVPITTDRGVFQDPQAFLARSIYRHIAVTSTADDGEGSLRQAIAAANATKNIACKIDFDIALAAGARVATIRPLTPLPALTANSLIIDGSTQRAAHGDTNPDGPEVEINGSNLSAGSGFELSAVSVDIRELIVNGFPGNGININSGLGRVAGCYIGTDATGRRAVPNGGRGVSISASLAAIRESVISGNARSGIFVATGQDILITNNRIGVAAGDELLPLGNGASGIYIGPSVGESAVAGNVIGFNHDAGVGLDLNARDITISANDIASNGGLPIDYGIDGVTPNGPPYRDQPPFPALTAARFDPATGKTVVEGLLDASFGGYIEQLEFFASESAEPRQAAQFLGRLPLGGNHGKDFRFEYDGDLRGRFITATYTAASSYYPELTGSRTSEVSDAIAVAGEAAAPLRRLPRGADLGLNFGGPFQVGRISAGERTTVNFSYSNLGPEEARDVALTIDMKGAAAVRIASQVGGVSCQLTGSARLVCTQPRLAPGESFGGLLELEAPLQAATIDMSASLTSATDDPDRSNNAGKITIDVRDEPALSISTQSPGPSDPGATAIHNIVVHNFAHLPVNDVTLTMPLRTGWSFVSANGGGWQCTGDPAQVVCRVATIDALQDSQFNLVLRAPQIESGQRRDTTPIRVTASRPLGFDPQASLVTEVVRIYHVTSPADAGAGTLRDVIKRANSECAAQALSCKAVFSLPPPVPAAGYYSIRPQTPLPPVTTALIIDAGTQTEATGDTNPLGPEVELNGSETATGNGILLHTHDIAGVRGLAINRFPENGVAVDAISNGSFGLRRVIADCYIGTDATGRAAAPNLRGIGVVVSPQFSAGVNIVDNVISGNARSGIFVANGFDVHIIGNRIGVTAGDAPAPLGNGASGIYLGSASSVQADQNVIAFNHDVGVGSDNTAFGIALQRNAIFANGHLGIDYGLDGVTFNDSAGRPASLPQFPLITSAVWDAASGVTRIEGVASASSFPFDRGTVDVYRNSAADPSGFGPAEEWIGDVVLEFSTQPRPFVLTVPRNLQGSFVAATYTRMPALTPPSRWTSELSATVPVTPSP